MQHSFLLALLGLVALTSALPPYEVKEYVAEIPCNSSTYCGDHALCGPYGTGHSDDVCSCEDSWATPSDFNVSGVLDPSMICSKERKKQLTAILLTVFLGGFGAGSYYMGWIVWGVIPLVICCGGCLLICIGQIACKGKGDGEGGPGVCVNCFAMILQCACTGLMIATLVFVATSDCVDPDGIKCQGT